MTFLDVVRNTIADLADDSREDAASAAVWLIIEAWPGLAEHTPTWDQVGLAALDAADRLFADSVVVMYSGSPARGKGEDGEAVRALVTALAAWCSRRAGIHVLPLSIRLNHDATAVRLRRAVAALP